MEKYIKTSFEDKGKKELMHTVLDYALLNSEIIELSIFDINLKYINKKLDTLKKNLIFSHKYEKRKPIKIYTYQSRIFKKYFMPTSVFKYSVDAFIINKLKRYLPSFFEKGLVLILLRKKLTKESRSKLFLGPGIKPSAKKNFIYIHGSGVFGNLKTDLVNLLIKQGYEKGTDLLNIIKIHLNSQTDVTDKK